jgi:dTMP kinase
MAARAQLVEEIIIPALSNGKVILCDRFLDSTIAYQGYGNGVNIEKIKNIGEFVTQGFKPGLTFLFDLDVEEGFARINRPKDRIEQRGIEYHNRVRNGYLKIARDEPDRVMLIDARKSKEEIQSIVQERIDQLLK